MPPSIDTVDPWHYLTLALATLFSGFIVVEACRVVLSVIPGRYTSRARNRVISYVGLGLVIAVRPQVVY